MTHTVSTISEGPRKTGDSERVRIDRWLWAARFFKSRGLAHAAIAGGKVRCNDERVKPAGRVGAGDRLAITKGEQIFEIDVVGVSKTRGPARAAAGLYVETAASVERRARQAEERRVARLTTPIPKHKPDKKQRRELRRFKQDRSD